MNFQTTSEAVHSLVRTWHSQDYLPLASSLTTAGMKAEHGQSHVRQLLLLGCARGYSGQLEDDLLALAGTLAAFDRCPSEHLRSQMVRRTDGLLRTIADATWPGAA